MDCTGILLALSLCTPAPEPPPMALAIAGFEVALPVGIITGLLVFIPYLGFGLGLVLALMGRKPSV